MVGVVMGEPLWLGGRDGLARAWRYKALFCLEYINIKSKVENFGWLAALERLMKVGCMRDSRRIALIVDSDLSQIAAYNQKKIAVDGGNYLPEGVTLVYASDAATENVANMLLSRAEAAAAQALDAVESGRLPFNQSAV